MASDEVETPMAAGLNNNPVVTGDAGGNSLPSSESSPPARVIGRLSRRKKWAFRLLALGLPFAGLLLLELALGWAGFGKDLKLIQAAGSGAPPEMYRFNPDADLAYYGATNLAGPEPRPFVLPKPAGTFRIVVVGASTVIGFPYPPELAFPRFLEIALREQGLNRDFEVLNAGITSISSTSEADVLKQAVDCQPDLIVVYTGHNEFVGPGSVGSRFGGVSPGWSSAFCALRRTRLHQATFRAFGLPTQDQRPLMEQLPGDLKIPLDAAKFQRAEEFFRANLERMVQSAGRAKVPLLFTTPITNLRHQSPIESLARQGLSAQQLADLKLAAQTGKKLLAAGRFEEAFEAFDRALAGDPGQAILAFRRAQCLEGLGRWPEALADYQSACDLDACRFRAPSSFARIIENVASSAAPETAHFLDTVAAFARETPHGIPGNESLLEHVHFTYDGNWRLALILAEHITRHILGGTWRIDRAPTAPARDKLCGVLPQDHFVALAQVQIMLERIPLNQSEDAASRIEALRSDVRKIFDELPAREGAVLGACNLANLTVDLITTLLAGYDESELDLETAALLRSGILRQPWRVDLLLSLAQWEGDHGNFDAARNLLDQVAKWKPRSTQAAQLRAQLDRRDSAAEISPSVP